ncbi:predicted protein [Postia placenta Mad-698-R]|nr:predicted protein [Postia placenta Mad-698-R]
MSPQRSCIVGIRASVIKADAFNSGVSPVRPVSVQPDTQLDDPEAVAEDVDVAVDLKNADRVAEWLKTTDGSEKPVGPDDADSDVASADMGMDLSGDDVSSPSAADVGNESETCTVADEMEDLHEMFDDFLFPKLSDPAFDLIPLVGISYDLTARGEPADPRGFLEEANFMAELIRKARDGTLEDVSDSEAVVAAMPTGGVQKEESLIQVPAAEHASAQGLPASDSDTTATEHLANMLSTALLETANRPLVPEADPSPHAEKDVVNTSSRSSKAWFPAKLAGLVRRVSARITAVSTSILRAVRLRNVRDDEH